MPARLDQITLGAPHPLPVIAFYDAVAGSVGLTRLDALVDEEEDHAAIEAAGWGHDGGTAFLWVVTSAPPTTGLHLRLRADTRADVDAFHAAGIRHGGRSAAAPRRWTLYRRGDYGAGVVDPLGNLVEVVATE